MSNKIVVLNRDAMALLVPTGVPLMLPKGTEVKIMQSLGGSFTVNVYGNLARISGKDADALGCEIHDPLADLPEDASVKDKMWVQLHCVYDPEIPVNIVDLGLVYCCEIEKLRDKTHYVKIQMTLTAPGCGMGPVIVEDAKKKLLIVPEISEVSIDIVFNPPWDRSMMSDTAKLQLGII